MLKVSQDVAAALCARATPHYAKLAEEPCRGWMNLSRSPRTRRIRLGHPVGLVSLAQASISRNGRMILATLNRALRLGGPAALVLAIALLRVTDARAGTTFYDAPLVFTRASHYTGTPPPISNFHFAGSEPNGGHAAATATSAAGPAYSFAQSAKGPTGMQAIAASAGDSAGGAQTFIRGVVSDPQNRPFVVWQVWFGAASRASWPGQAGWEVLICEWSGAYGLVKTDDEGKVTGSAGLGCGQVYFRSLARVRSENGGGYYAEHIVFENGEVARREISNYDVVQSSQDSWLVGEIVVPNGTELMAWIYANSSTHGSGATVVKTRGGLGNGIAEDDDVGSILAPHPDNADAAITWYAEEAPPGPPFGGFGPEDLVERGIGAEPFIDLGLFESEPPAPEVPCTGGTPLSDVKLTMSKGGAVDEAKLHLRGKITLLPLPLDPPFDPVARGARAFLADTSGVLLDETLPGGAFDRATSTGWKHRQGGKSWVYTRPASEGIHRLTFKRIPKTENVYAFTLDAWVATSVPTPAELPLEATLVIDAPVAKDGQCGTVQFGPGPSTPACEIRKGARLVCE